MKKLVVLGLIVLCAASQPARKATGTDWQKWDASSRLAYVKGAIDVSNEVEEIQAIFHATNPAEHEAINLYVPSVAMSAESIAEAVNGFFSNPANIRVPILEALEIIKARIEGKSQSCITEKTIQARLAAAQSAGAAYDYFDKPKTAQREEQAAKVKTACDGAL